MLPLEEIFLIPSLFVAPFVLVIFAWLRKRKKFYPQIWLAAIIACVILCGVFFLQVRSTPLFSERVSVSRTPYSGSSNMTGILGIFLVGTCVVIPAFPVLIGLACMPPRQWKTVSRVATIAVAAGYVVILGTSIRNKNSEFNENYLEYRNRPRQSNSEQWKLYREASERSSKEREKREKQKKAQSEKRQKEIQRELEVAERAQREQLEEGKKRVESMGEKERADWEKRKKRLVENIEETATAQD